MKTTLQILPEIDPERKKLLLSFQKKVMIKFKNLSLLNLALMHRSLSNESGYKFNNERLEFLGDAILGAVTATLLYETLRDKNEGELAKIKSVVVSEEVLSGIARELQIDTILLLGRGEDLSGGRTKKAILADALEALIGALYLDSGYKPIYGFVSRIILPEINRVLDNRHFQDYKSLLQELSQRLTKTYPVYRLLKRSGPEHDRFFWVEVQVNSQHFGPGTGRNKKSAEQAAAKIAFETLSQLPRESNPRESDPREQI
ncbi:MAG: ribonuclease III [Spirochaetaceae bacterium]|jgi:ribonuclease-3|nr:ribonuclease III [Spirochaetaceae bacterium]